MNKSTFTIFSKVQDLEVIPTKIFATNDLLNSFLYIPVKFTFRQPSLDSHYDIESITAQLYADNSFIASTTEITRFNIDMRDKKEEREQSQIFKFHITDRAINFIEKFRNGDIRFRMEFKGSIKVKTLFNFKRNGGTLEVKSLAGNLELMSDLYIDIPQSQWVKNILEDLNYNSFLFVEVPLTHKTLREAYEGVAKEFAKAEKYFRDQKYYECVGACRKTMDDLTKQLYNFKNNIGSKSNYKWLEEIAGNTRTWIDSINQINQTITSKPHHKGDHEYERHEAESVYLITLGLMNYIAYVKS